MNRKNMNVKKNRLIPFATMGLYVRCMRLVISIKVRMDKKYMEGVSK